MTIILPVLHNCMGPSAWITELSDEWISISQLPKGKSNSVISKALQGDVAYPSHIKSHFSLYLDVTEVPGSALALIKLFPWKQKLKKSISDQVILFLKTLC